MARSGRELAEGLTPSPDVEEVKRRQSLTAEAMALQRLKPHFALGSVNDVGSQANAAARGGRLTAVELLDVLGFLRSARHIRNHVAPLARELPQLSHIARQIGEFGSLSDDISNAVDARGEVLDSASPVLPALRQAARDRHDRLLQRVERILDRALAQGIAQESIVTERDGRYVIPIKAESRSHLPSVVHDVSSSGATVFVEPLAVVELGNAWREARLEEEREVERVLRRLSALVGEAAGAILASLRALGELDFAIAKAALAAELGAALPVAGAAPDWIVESPNELRLQSARHPLLRGDVVPISLTVGGAHHGVLITGPNTGGKTVALKTVGLLTLMAQAGLPVPAEAGTQIPVYQGVYADIGDEQSIEQSLSTFSSHMTNIIRILEEAGAQSLVLLDELGAGTDPSEGAALGRAILGYLLNLDASVVATTHHGELKLFAHTAEGLINASVEFDPETLAPTYRLLMGLPGRSNALAIARRLGMPQNVLDAAQARFGATEAGVESLLADLQQERRAASDARRADEFARREAEEIRDHLGRRRDEIETEREALIARTEHEMEQQLALLRKAVRAADKQLSKNHKESIRAARGHVAAAERRLDQVRRERVRAQRRRTGQRHPRPDPRSIRVGDVLHLAGVEQAGEALTPVGEDGYLEVQLGSLRTRVHSDEVERLGWREQRRGEIRYQLQQHDPGSRIEVRGQTLDEALPTIDQFLDRAYRAGLRRLEVVHGKGTGTLRQAVRDMLRTHPLVSTFEGGAREEGGEGVTIVHMAV